MNFLSKCLFVTLFGIVLLGLSKAQPTATSTPISDASILASLFDDSCANPCYLGIEPGVTTLDTLVASLETKLVSYRYESGLVSWDAPLQAGVTDGIHGSGFTVAVRDEIVVQLLAPINIPLDAVLEVFGSPSTSFDEFGTISLNYPEIGLAFYVVPNVDARRVSFLVSTISKQHGTIVRVPAGTPVTQACETFGAPPCIAPTATPTAVSTPAEVDEQSLSPEGQALLNLFSGPDCQRTCFLGIQPNVTTEQELVGSLVAENIQYYVLPSQIQWYAPDLPLLFSGSAIDVHIVSGMVDQLKGRLDTTVDVVVEVFGSPPVATIDDRAKAATPDLIVIVYPELGLAFYVDRLAGSNDAISFFNLAYPGHGYSWAEDPPGEPLVQDCPTYGTGPCMVATATPTP